MGRVTTRRPAAHLTASTVTQRPETLVVEEPLEIRLNGSALTVTMRTPGSDIELAQGFLLTEGVIGSRDDVLTVRYCRGADDGPTIGLLLCSEKSEAVARYSVLADQQQLFAAKYLPYLPSEEELKRELQRERERALVRMAQQQELGE